MAKSEPDWETFRVDPQWDPPGIKQAKLFAFMEAFINWRAVIHTTPPDKPPRKGRRSKVTT